MAYVRRIEILKGCTTKIVNHNLISRNEVDEIHFAIIDCLSQYNLEDSEDLIIESIEISKRLKTTAGRCDWSAPYVRDQWGNNTQKTFNIRLAYNNYEEFGFDSMIKTLRHEMAHLIEVMLHGRSGHSERFKRICVKLGGHMNSQMAGKRHKDNATKDYCKSTKKSGYKYKYHCKCGMNFGRKRIINNFNTLRGTCRTCGTMVMDMRMEVL